MPKCFSPLSLVVFLNIAACSSLVEEKGPAPVRTMASTPSAAECRELAPGESKVVHFQAPISDWSPRARFPVTASYRLQRVDNNSWEATLLADFVNGRGGNRELTQVMRDRVQACVAEANVALARGEPRLRLRVMSSREAARAGIPSRERPPRQRIINVGNYGRGSAIHFDHSFRCPAIMHELMHHMGLYDEYLESSVESASRAPHPCRPQHYQVSLMRDMVSAHAAAVGGKARCDFTHPLVTGVLTQAASDPGVADRLFRKTVIDVGLGIEQDMAARSRWCQAPRYLPRGTHDPSPGRVVQDGLDQLRVQSTAMACAAGSGPCQIREEVAELSCRCPSTGDPEERANCRSYLERVKAEVLAMGSEKIYRCPRLMAGQTVVDTTADTIPTTAGDQPGIRFTPGRSEVTITSAASPDARLLLPGHVEKIIAGTCWEGARKYNECSRYIYADQIPNNQRQAAENDPAAFCEENFPEICRDPLIYLGPQD